jgi:TonB family protein
MLIALAQAPTQSTTSDSKSPRLQMKQKDMCCYAVHVVSPVYPKEARLAHTEGTVKLTMIVAPNGRVADIQDVSGDPLLSDSVVNAVRQWRLQPVLMNGNSAEAEVPLTFTFSIYDPPKPAYLHLKNGDVIRADRVREFTDGIEYTVGHSNHRIPADSVLNISGCGHDCVAGGGPSFNIRAIPLLPAEKESNAISH